MEFREPTEYRINDVVFRAWDCLHCGARCSEREAQEAVAEYWRHRANDMCAVCGTVIAYKSWEIEHHQDGAVSKWSAWPSEPALAVALRHSRWNGATGCLLHPECAKKAMPFVSQEFWREPVQDPSRSWFAKLMLMKDSVPAMPSKKQG